MLVHGIKSYLSPRLNCVAALPCEMRPVQFCDYSHCCTYCISGNEKTLYILWCVVGFVDSDVDSLAFRVPRSTKRRHIYSTSGFHWIHMRRRDIGFILYWAVLYVLIQHRAAVCRTAIERHSVCLSVCLCVCVCVCVWQCYTGSLLGGRVHVLCRTTLDRGIMGYIVVYCIRYRD